MNAPDTLSLPIGDARVTVPTKTILRALLERLDGNALTPAADQSAPAIGTFWLGGMYAGITIHDNKPMHLILLDGDVEKKWAEAKSWATEQGGELPSRFDGLVLFKNLKSEFQERWYWTAEQYASDSDYAWVQSFDDGRQYDDSTTLKFRARAVRRLEIQ